MSVHTEFSDYPLHTLPPLPDTWVDTSWHNDACPSWQMPGGLYVYVDYEDAAQREHPEGGRFTVVNMDDDTVAYHGDDWQEVLGLDV